MGGQQKFKWQHESKTGNAGHQNVVSVSRETLAEHIWQPPQAGASWGHAAVSADTV